MIHLDASQGEGGGQVLRTSLALSMVTGTPVTLTHIRARRPRPGLMRQHLTCVQAAQTLSGAEVSGAALGASTLSFAPGPLRGGAHTFSVGTAGSVMLVLQTVWPALLLAETATELTLHGGTHNPMAPTFHFIERAYAPLVQRLGAPVTLSLRRCGFYPGGGGDLRVALSPVGPAGLQPFDVLTRGARQSTWAECLIPGLKRSIAERELTLLCQRLGWSPEQGHIGQARQNEGPGNALLAIVEHEHLTEVFSAIGDKGRSAETVADDVAQQVQRYLSSSAALGPYLADQWVLPLALAVWCSGRSAAYTCTGISLHAATNFQVIERFLPVHIHTEPLADGSGQRVSVQPR